MPDLNVPLTLNAQGADVQELHASLSKLGYVIPKRELDEQEFGVGTQDAVLQLQIKYKLPRTGIFDEATRASMVSALTEAETVQHHVEGRIFLDYGLPAGGVAVRLYTMGFGGADTQLGE